MVAGDMVVGDTLSTVPITIPATMGSMGPIGLITAPIIPLTIPLTTTPATRTIHTIRTGRTVTTIIDRSTVPDTILTTSSSTIADVANVQAIKKWWERREVGRRAVIDAGAAKTRIFAEVAG